MNAELREGERVRMVVNGQRRLGKIVQIEGGTLVVESRKPVVKVDRFEFDLDSLTGEDGEIVINRNNRMYRRFHRERELRNREES
jgi:hypothetical protein